MRSSRESLSIRKIGDAKVGGRYRKSRVERPKPMAREPGGHQELHIVPTEPATIEQIRLDKIERFFNGSSRDSRQTPQIVQGLETLDEISGGQLPEDHRVNGYLVPTQNGGKLRHPATKVLNPNRGVRQNHFRAALLDRVRGGTASADILPPSAARRRPASRSMRATKPIRTSAVFSVSPVYSPAWPNKSSSIFSVVRIHTLMPFEDAWSRPSRCRRSLDSPLRDAPFGR